MSEKKEVPEPLQRPGDRNENLSASPRSHPQHTANLGACQDAVDIEPAEGGGILRVRGRIAGQVVGTCLRKTVCRSRHLLRMRAAWVWDVAVLRAAADLGCTWVQVHDAESGNTYRASMADLRAKGFRVDLGCGTQWGLALPDFELAVGNQNPFTLDDSGPRQLALLG